MRFIVISLKDLLESTDLGADCWATAVPKTDSCGEVPVKLFKPRIDWLLARVVRETPSVRMIGGCTRISVRVV